MVLAIGNGKTFNKKKLDGKYTYKNLDIDGVSLDIETIDAYAGAWRASVKGCTHRSTKVTLKDGRMTSNALSNREDAKLCVKDEWKYEVLLWLILSKIYYMEITRSGNIHIFIIFINIFRVLGNLIVTFYWKKTLKKVTFRKEKT